MTNQERLKLLGEKKGDRCFCGKRKQSMSAFCRKHFSSLPTSLQSGLNKRFDEGYEEAYTAAREWLKEREHPAVMRVE